MSFSRPIQRYHSHADPIWPDGTFKGTGINRWIFFGRPIKLNQYFLYMRKKMVSKFLVFFVKEKNSLKVPSCFF
jgi:hypothetical protein